MHPRTALLFWHLGFLTKKRYDALTEVHGSIDHALAALDAVMLQKLGCRSETSADILKRYEAANVIELEKACADRRIRLLTIEDEEYPPLLKSITDPPVFLSVVGDVSILSEPCVALVGTRAMSAYGKRVTEAFVRPLVQAGIVTVSGLAYGIDAAVAAETIACGGRTVAVLGSGFDAIYPTSHRALADEIVATGGVLVSEFPLTKFPDLYTFPARNRIIAGLSRVTVVLEAAKKSGSLITAELSEDYGRDVFAVPGQIFDSHYGGCHEIIASQRAQIAVSPDDVLIALGIAAARAAPKREVALGSDDERAAYRSLSAMPQCVDDLAVKSKLDTAVLGGMLTMLELKGVAKNTGEGMWIRSG